MRVYHFSSAASAVSVIALKRIKVSRFHDLNDPFELLCARMPNRAVRRAVMAYAKEIDSRLGLLCFTRGYREPILWGHYADKHRGVCLGFDLADDWVAPVKYVKSRPNIITEDGTVDEEAFVRTSIYKDRTWSYEKEIRTFIVLKRISVVENGVYFKQLNERLALREVLLGPRCSLPIEAIDALVRDRYESVTVRKTELARKVFAVLPVRRR